MTMNKETRRLAASCGLSEAEVTEIMNRAAKDHERIAEDVAKLYPEPRLPDPGETLTHMVERGRRFDR